MASAIRSFSPYYANPNGYTPLLNYGGGTGTLISAPGSPALFNPHSQRTQAFSLLVDTEQEEAHTCNLLKNP